MKIGLIALYDLNSFSIRTLHSVLVKNNISVESLFFKCENPNNVMDKPSEEEIESLINIIKLSGYDIIGISVRSSIFSLVEDITARIKKINKNIKIILGGVQPTLNPSKCFNNVDIIIIGEGEKAILDICSNKDLYEINNIYFKDNGKIIKNNAGYVEENLDKIPFPDFSDKNKYFFNEGKIMPLKTSKYRTRYSLMTSRGCPFNCNYCCNSALRKIYKGKYLRRRSVDNVMEELILAKKQFPNLLFISFLDDVFTFDMEWVKDFSIKYEKHINLPFYCYVHPAMCNEETIKILSEAGLSFTTMGVQTFSDRIKKYYKRPETNEQIIESTRILNKYGVSFGIDIIMDNPLENEADMKQNLEWLYKIKHPFTLHTHTLTFFPNTELTSDFIKNRIITYEQIEDNLEKGWQRWTPALDLKRDKLNLFYDCLYFLAKLKYRNKTLIRLLQRNKYFRENPDKLAKIIKIFSIDFLSLDWNSRTDRIKFFISQGILSLFKGEFRFLYLKMKQLIKDKDYLIV